MSNYHALQKISKNQYQATWLTQNATSIAEFPAAPTYERYRCQLHTLDPEQTYPARAVDVDRRRFLRSFDDGAQSISYAELVDIEHLREEMLEERAIRSMGRRRAEPHVITEHCSGCGTRVIKDGCKEFLDLLHHNERVEIVVTEVSGTDWSQSIYDMRLVCTCPK